MRIELVTDPRVRGWNGSGIIGFKEGTLKRLLLIVLLVVSMNCRAAEAAKIQPVSFEDLKNRPGATVSTDGKSIELPGGVTISDGGQTAIDHSGHGAVLCGWMLYSELKNYADKCKTDIDKTHAEELNKAVDRVDAFIVTNSLTPTTKAEIETWRGMIPTACEKPELKTMFDGYKAGPAEKLNQMVDGLLSVPRPAVMNPCL
jgi:hypothetical protein